MVGQKPQQVFMVPLLVGTDGALKMSKSVGNYIGIAESPENIYGKVMSITDGLIMQYFELLTDVPDQELEDIKQQLAGGANPMTLKKRLAREIVAQFHGDNKGKEADTKGTLVRDESDLEEDLEFDEEDESIDDIGSVLTAQTEPEEGFQIEGEVPPDADVLDDDDDELDDDDEEPEED